MARCKTDLGTIRPPSKIVERILLNRGFDHIHLKIECESATHREEPIQRLNIVTRCSNNLVTRGRMSFVIVKYIIVECRHQFQVETPDSKVQVEASISRFGETVRLLCPRLFITAKSITPGRLRYRRTFSNYIPRCQACIEFHP